MTTISHKNLAGTQLHELKGVAAATDNFVPVAISGATNWQKLTAASLTGTANPFGGQLLHVRDERTNGSNGTAPGTASTWNTRVLQTIKTNEISSASLTSNQISLPAGTYRCEAWAAVTTSTSGNRTTARLRNITNSTTLLVGKTANIGGVSSTNFSGYLWSGVYGTFTLAGTSTLALQSFDSANVTPPAASTGEVEIYAEIMIWKIA